MERRRPPDRRRGRQRGAHRGAAPPATFAARRSSRRSRSAVARDGKPAGAAACAGAAARGGLERGLIAARDRAGAAARARRADDRWSNLHGGFIFGLALIGPFALEAVAGRRRSAARRARVGPFALAALAAALVNPYGVEALSFRSG